MLFILSSARLSEQTSITFSMTNWKDVTELLGSKGCDQQSEFQFLAQEPVLKGALQRLMQEPVLFSIFINNLDDGKSLSNNWNPGVVNDWEGPWQSGEMDQQESNEFSQREEQRSCAWGGMTSCTSGYTGGWLLECSCGENYLAVLVLNVSDTMWPCTQNLNSILGCWRQCIAIRLWVFFPLYSMQMWSHLECWIQLLRKRPTGTVC